MNGHSSSWFPIVRTPICVVRRQTLSSSGVARRAMTLSYAWSLRQFSANERELLFDGRILVQSLAGLWPVRPRLRQCPDAILHMKNNWLGSRLTWRQWRAKANQFQSKFIRCRLVGRPLRFRRRQLGFGYGAWAAVTVAHSARSAIM